MQNSKPVFLLQDSLAHWVIRLSRIMQYSLSQQLSAYQLNARLLAVLMSVEETKSCTPSAIASHLLVDRAVIARALRDLQSRNLIQLERNEHDGRSRTLSLTDEGKAMLQLGRDCMRDCDGYYRDRLPAGLTDSIRNLFLQTGYSVSRKR